MESSPRQVAHNNTAPHQGKILEPVAVPFKGYTAMTGVMCGLAFSESIMFKIPLPYPRSTSHGIARCILGLSGLMAVFLGLGAIEKKMARRCEGEVPPLSAQALRFGRYGSVPVVILLLAPMLFKKLRL